MKTIRILCGIQCSGKSTYASSITFPVVSRDYIREKYFDSPYIYTREHEALVSTYFDNMVVQAFKRSNTVIFDNTHCREKYLDDVINKYPECKIEIIVFEISLIKAYYRNIIRYIQTGKWVSFKIIRQFNENFKQINFKKYEQYLV